MSLECLAGALSLGPGQRNVLGRTFRRRVLITVGLDHFVRHAMLPQLEFDHPSATGAMTIALFAPPTREGRIVEISEIGQTLRR